MWQPRPLVSRKGILLYLDGLIPSKKNSRITVRRTGRSFPSKKYSEWHKDAMSQLEIQGQDGGMQEYHAFEICGKPVMIRAHLFFGTHGRADASNKIESVMDLLVDANIITDDSWQYVPELHITASYRKRAPGALIRIVPRG